MAEAGGAAATTWPARRFDVGRGGPHGGHGQPPDEASSGGRGQVSFLLAWLHGGRLFSRRGAEG